MECNINAIYIKFSLKDWNDELKAKEIKQENQGFERNKDKEQKLDDEFAQDLQRRLDKSKNISKGFGRS